MSYSEPTSDLHRTDAAPGDQRLDRAEIAEGIKSYLVGLGLSILLTVMSFFISGTTLVWGPSIPVALVVLAIAQMGVHLVFFLHITTAPDNVNNVLALAFGVLIVLLVLAGSLWIMAHLNYNMKPMDQMMPMQLERGPGARAITAKGVVGPATAASVGPRVSGVIQAIHCNAIPTSRCPIIRTSTWSETWHWPWVPAASRYRVSPVAMQQGTHAAKAIMRKVQGAKALRPFKYFDKGELAVIGRATAVGNIFRPPYFGAAGVARLGVRQRVRSLHCTS